MKAMACQTVNERMTFCIVCLISGQTCVKETPDDSVKGRGKPLPPCLIQLFCFKGTPRITLAQLEVVMPGIILLI